MGADFDGDGDIDAVSGSSCDRDFVWHENVNNSNDWISHTVATYVAFRARALEVGDLDGDGDIDIIGTADANEDGFSGAVVAWYENDGSASTWTPHTVSGPRNGIAELSTGDIDGDGNLDIASATQDDDSITWYENSGGASSWAAHTVSTGVDSAFSLALGDFDKDGDLDIGSGASGNGTIYWHENDGTGKGWLHHTAMPPGGDTSTLAASDIDGDGDIDLTASGYLFGDTIWLENRNDGDNWSIHTIASNSVNRVFPADVDGDGDVDIMAAAYFSNEVLWFDNNGTAEGWPVRRASTQSGGAVDIYPADIDSDGDTDVFSATRLAYNTRLLWHRNDTIHGSAKFATSPITGNSYSGILDIAAGDSDQDGVSEVAMVSRDADTVILIDKNSMPEAWTVQTIASNLGSPESVSPADLDSDGDIDFLLAETEPNWLSWIENLGDSGWQTHSIASVSGYLQNAEAMDIDEDGDTDIVFATLGTGTVAWIENLNAASNWTRHDIFTQTDWVEHVFPGDVDGDADMDIIAALYESEDIVWFENRGGSGWRRHDIGNVRTPTKVLGADLDSDGDMDVLAGSILDSSIEWFENSGNGTTWQARMISTTTPGINALVARDLDADGDLDLLSASWLDDLLSWHENPGTGPEPWVTRVIDVPNDTGGTFAAVAADFDGDGDLDAISASAFSEPVKWHENRGGQFALPTLSLAQQVVNDASTYDLLDIQAIHRGRAGDSDAELVTLELKFTDAGGADLTSGEADALIENLHIYLDDGSGAFDSGSDTLVHTVSSLALTAGVQTVSFSDDIPELQFPFGSPKVYFVVADMTADAASQTPSAFQVGHITESSSTGEDASADIPLTLEFWPNTGTGIVDTELATASCNAPFDLELSNRTVTTTVACEAGTFIRAGDAFVVGSGGGLRLSAGETIRFTSGFHVDEGTLSVTINPALQP